MRAGLDSRTIAVGALAVLLAAGLGGLAGGTAGVAAGVLAALAGLVSSAVLAVALERRTRNAARAKRRQELLTTFASPVPAYECGDDREGLARPATGDVARFLRPEEAVVGFRERPELAELLDWCAVPGRVAVRLVTASGGAGKTRLALRLGEEMAANGWQPLWVPRGHEGVAAAAVWELGQPAVLVVDYAETREGLGAMLGDAAGWDGPDMRILLLARGSGEWWQRLATGAEDRVARLLEAAPVPLGPLEAPGGPAELFSEALTAFAGKLGVARPDARLVLEGPEPVVLVVHAAALLTVLDHDSGGQEVRSPGEVLGRLLAHEARYWARSAAARGLGLDAVVQRRAVAAGCLIGAASEADAARLMACLPDLADSGERRGQVARWLHDLYPDNRASEVGPGEWIGPLRPDLIAEHLVVSEFSAQQGLVSGLFAGLEEDRVARALTVLARAARTQPAALTLLRDALTAHPGELAVPAMSVAVETNPVVGELLSEVLDSRPVSAQVLERIAEVAPYPSFALAPVAATALAQLADQAGDAGQRATRLVNLGTWLADLGRPEEALAAMEEAVTAYRDLARARPDAFLPDLAMALNNQSVRLADLGRREDALAAIEEAVTAYRDLARERPDAFLPDLATSLNNQSLWLAGLGRREDALAAIEEAVTAYRDLARERPDAFLPDLAMALNNQSVRLAGLGRREDALAVIEEAVTAYRDLARERPDAFLPDLATSLNNQSVRLADLGRREDALAAIEEAVTAYRDLARERPDAFLPDLAMALNNQSVRLADLGRREDALAVIEEAVTAYRDLARERPDAFLPDLAMALNNQSVRLADLGRREDALAAIEEAVTIRRDLARSRPGLFGSVFSNSLDHLAELLSAFGRNTEAEAALVEAESVRQMM